MNTNRAVLAGSALVVAAVATGETLSLDAASGMCTIRPGSTRALIRVESDTTLPLAGGAPGELMSASRVPRGPHDSLLADPSTRMPAARVTILRMDTVTRSVLDKAGIAEREPVVFIRAEPYRADCRTIRWTDTLPFVVRGDTGYMRASLAPRAQWLDDRPLFVIRQAWYYPYPRQRALAFRVPSSVRLAPAQAMYTLDSALNGLDMMFSAMDSAGRERALAWMRANSGIADMEPVRTIARRSALFADFTRASRAPSRLRGTYRVRFEVGGDSALWYFRTHDRPAYQRSGPDTAWTTAEFLASPYMGGYVLVGYAAASPDSILADRRRTDAPLIWLGSTDRPTAPGNDARRMLQGELQFRLGNVPEKLWSDLEAFVSRMSPSDSMIFARMNRMPPRASQNPRLPITLRLDAGGVRADTTLDARGRPFRVRLERIDTTTVPRSF